MLNDVTFKFVSMNGVQFLRSLDLEGTIRTEFVNERKEMLKRYTHSLTLFL